jgi:single-strand DNA-binding protein
VQVWGKTAEHCAQYQAKGRSVYVEGRLESREYADKDGVKRKVWEVRADKVTFLGTGKGDGEQRPSTSQAVWQGSGPPKSKRDEAPPFDGDPIPF